MIRRHRGGEGRRRGRRNLAHRAGSPASPGRGARPSLRLYGRLDRRRRLQLHQHPVARGRRGPLGRGGAPPWNPPDRGRHAGLPQHQQPREGDGGRGAQGRPDRQLPAPLDAATTSFRAIAEARASRPDVYYIEALIPGLDLLAGQLREAGESALSSVVAPSLSERPDLFEDAWYTDSNVPDDK